MSQSEAGMVCGCGLPMSRNPHADAGLPNEAGVKVGYQFECIPCLVATRNRVGASWREAQAALAIMVREFDEETMEPNRLKRFEQQQVALTVAKTVLRIGKVADVGD